MKLPYFRTLTQSFANSVAIAAKDLVEGVKFKYVDICERGTIRIAIHNPWITPSHTHKSTKLYNISLGAKQSFPSAYYRSPCRSFNSCLYLFYLIRFYAHSSPTHTHSMDKSNPLSLYKYIGLLAGWGITRTLVLAHNNPMKNKSVCGWVETTTTTGTILDQQREN